MNFYDVLAAEKWGGGIPTINFFDLLFAQYMGGSEQWETYEGTLPATINANGDNMKQYQIYGATGGVGDDSGTAYGYEIDIGVKSGNMFDKNSLTIGYAIYPDGSISENDNYAYSDLMSVEQGQYSISGLMTTASSLRWSFRVHGYKNGVWQKQIYIQNIQNIMPKNVTINVPSGIDGIRISIGINDRQNIDILSVSHLPPSKYQPYSNITTPIYIGDDPLDKDEYIDYQAGKIYRMINGVLMPTDPPVPLPALPTCDGTTVIDYAGESVAPEKVYFEYKGGKQP